MPNSELLRHSFAKKLFARVIQHGLLRFRKKTRTCSQAAVDVCGLALDQTFKGSIRGLTHIRLLLQLTALYCHSNSIRLSVCLSYADIVSSLNESGLDHDKGVIYTLPRG